MSFTALMDWLGEHDPRETTPEGQLAILTPAIVDFQSRLLAPADRPALEQMLTMACLLAQSEGVGEELEQLFIDYGHFRHENHHEDTELADLLESDLVTVARRLPEWAWRAEIYSIAFEAAEAYQAGQVDIAEEKLDEIEERVLGAFGAYCQVPMEESEVTAESIVGHRLVKRGVEEWIQAVNRLRDAADGNGEYQDAMLRAEIGTRYLVVVQKFTEKIQRQVKM